MALTRFLYHPTIIFENTHVRFAARVFKLGSERDKPVDGDGHVRKGTHTYTRICVHEFPEDIACSTGIALTPPVSAQRSYICFQIPPFLCQGSRLSRLSCYLVEVSSSQDKSRTGESV